MRLRTVGVGVGLAVPAVVAGGSSAAFLARTAAARRAGQPLERDVPAPAPSLGLAAAVALDALVDLPMGLLSSIGSADDVVRSSTELDQAARFYDDAGWLADPTGRHPAPDRTPDAQVIDGGDAELLRFESGWQPVEGEPAGDRWRSFEANTVARATLLRHPGPPRPWLVVVHGQGMGRAGDARMLGARRLHEALGINVALPVLPLHGPRRGALAPDQQFVSNVFLLNNVLGLTQAVWDLRRLLRWLREEQSAPAVGVLGVSLGSYVCSLLSTLEADLRCVVAVVPTSDLAAALRRAEPVTAAKARRHRALHDERSTAVHGVVSPLALPCLVPHEHRLIVAGQADRIAPPGGAAELWRHWDRPAIGWRPRGHLTTFRSAGADGQVADVLIRSGIEGEH